IWGVGPIFQFPTASSPELGTGRWSAGPTAAVVYSEGPRFNAILAYQLMSFAGNRDRGSVNQTFLSLTSATTSKAAGTSSASPRSRTIGQPTPPTPGLFRWAR